MSSRGAFTFFLFPNFRAVRAWSFAKSDYLFFSWYRTFEFTEKKEVDKYYPQYYHKIDKVREKKKLHKSKKTF